MGPLTYHDFRLHATLLCIRTDRRPKQTKVYPDDPWQIEQVSTFDARDFYTSVKYTNMQTGVAMYFDISGHFIQEQRMFSGRDSARHWAFSLLGLQAWGRGRKRTIFSQVCSTSVEQSSPLLVRNFRLRLKKYLALLKE